MVRELVSVLRTHRFSEEDRIDFAEISGDANPLHMDPIEARRTLMGAPIVHGMHLVLLALEAVNGELDQALRLARLHARFLSPVMVGDTVEWRLVKTKGTHWQLEVSVQDDPVLDLRIDWALRSSDNDSIIPPLHPVPLHDLLFNELPGMAGSLQVGIDTDLARRLFPCFVARFGVAVLADLMALTRLVGMRCPGRHSLFNQFDVAFHPSQAGGMLHFQVKEVDERFLRVVIQIEGNTLNGKLVAFCRPLPQPQRQMADLARVSRRDEFRDSTALVIGGSRGLGEATAKLLTVGGARVIVTYHRGEADAARLKAEIQSCGGRCEYARLDVLDSAADVEKIFAAPDPPRTIYYFATPHIFVRRRDRFSPDLLQNFLQYYVFGFFQIVASASRSKGKLRVFFPSTVAIDEDLREVAEYSLAKKIAENIILCCNRFLANVEIIAVRLPRVKTDQTAALMDIPAEDAANVMLPIIRRVELMNREC
jgi:acyl dehydratase